MSDQCQGCGERGVHAEGCEVKRLEARVEELVEQYGELAAIGIEQAKRTERLEAALLDFFVHDKRETRTALRDLVGGFDAIDRHKQALKGEGDE